MSILRFCTVAAVATITLQPAYAEVDKDLAVCAAMTNSVARLACFDSLASERGAAPSSDSTTPDGSGKWETSTDTDPLTDKAIHYAILEADSGVGRLGRKPTMIIRCKDNRTEMFITWNSYLGSDSISTTYRIDKQPAQKSGWSLSTDKRAAFFPGSPVPTLKQLEGSTSFVANVTPYNESPVTAVFDTTGAEKALADIRKGCNW